MSDSVRPHRWQPNRLPHPWDSPGKNTGVGCHFLLQCMKVKSESEVAQSCLTSSDPMDCSPPGSSIHGIFQARVLEWGAIGFSTFPGRWMYFRIYLFLKKTHLYVKTPGIAFPLLVFGGVVGGGGCWPLLSAVPVGWRRGGQGVVWVVCGPASLGFVLWSGEEGVACRAMMF